MYYLKLSIYLLFISTTILAQENSSEISLVKKDIRDWTKDIKRYSNLPDSIKNIFYSNPTTFKTKISACDVNKTIEYLKSKNDKSLFYSALLAISKQNKCTIENNVTSLPKEDKENIINTENEQLKDKIERNIEDLESITLISKLLTFFVVALSLLSLLIFFYLSKKIKKNNLNNDDKIKDLIQENEKLKKENNELNFENNKNKNIILNLNSQIDNKDRSINISIDRKNDLEQIEIPKLENYYLPPPSGDTSPSSFLNKRYNQADSNAFYQLILDKQNLEIGDFSFNNTPFIVKSAVSNIQSYVDIACDYPIFNPNASQIITTTKGKVKLVDNRWQIIEKAKIEFK